MLIREDVSLTSCFIDATPDGSHPVTFM